MSETAVICLDDAVRRELAVARAKHGNSWEVQSIADSWGDTMDDRETLGAIRLSTAPARCWGENKSCSKPYDKVRPVPMLRHFGINVTVDN